MRATRLGRLVVNLVCVLVILGCAAWLVPSLLGYERYVITGGSMSGTFEKGSVAFEKVVPTADLRVGDVITYQPPPSAGTTSLVTHRIVSVRADRNGTPVYRTKGDANATADPWRFSLTARTQPVVAFTVPKAGYVFIALADRTTRMALIGGPATLIALLALAEAARNVRRREEDAAEAAASGGATVEGAPAAAPVALAG